MFPLRYPIHSTNDFGILRTGAILGVNTSSNQYPTLNTIQLSYEENYERSLKGPNSLIENRSKNSNKNIEIKAKKHTKKQSKHKLKKCFHKFLKGKGHKLWKKKFLMPMLIGFIAAKSLLLPLALKALAFVSFKGLLMGFLSATVLSLRGVLSHSYRHYP